MTLLEKKPNHENSNSSKFEGLKKEEIEKLWNLITSLDKPKASCSLVRSSKHSMIRSFSASKNCWNHIESNSGAINHMTHNSHHFSCYNLCPRNQKIKVVNGSLETVARRGAITLTHLLS